MARTTIRTEDITASEVTTAKMAVDPTNASNLSSGSVPLAQLGNVDTSGISANKDDIALLAFKTQANGNLARYNLVDQSVDSFEDASGVDASASTNERRDASGKYYEGTTTTAVTATGGTVTTDGDYSIHSITATGSTNYVTDTAQTIDYLIVAGGGGGGKDLGGGGGAGGYRYFTSVSLAAGTFAAVVGDGGAGSTSTSNKGSNGDNSSFNGSTSNGGGGGASRSSGAGAGGGSGGGGAGVFTSSTGAGGGNYGGYSPVEGYDGGAAIGNRYGGGAGGGAGGVGAPANTSGVANPGGNGGVGGVGLSNSITGSAVFYAGGGGGCGGGGGSAGAGGNGGGGAGTHVDGTANTGGGGGGGEGGANGGAGGSGIVIIRRPTSTITEGGDLSLVSNTLTATDAVTKGDLVVTATNGAGTTTVNTDIKGWISRDNGSNYTQATLVSQGTTGGHNIYTANDITLGGSDTSQMRWKITTHNQSGSKTTRIQAVSLGWS